MKASKEWMGGMHSNYLTHTLSKVSVNLRTMVTLFGWQSGGMKAALGAGQIVMLSICKPTGIIMPVQHYYYDYYIF